MNKRIVIPIIVTLAIGAILIGSLLLREHNKLTGAQVEIVVLRESLFSLETTLTEETTARKLAQAEIITLTQTISG
ncbi:hypothetical protein LR021_03215, partial [Candidatus Bipolaricaulota bacterium]|nr:hypothetical protein [Candidatus Bipolaricaulota bacterium]